MLNPLLKAKKSWWHYADETWLILTIPHKDNEYGVYKYTDFFDIIVITDGKLAEGAVSSLPGCDKNQDYLEQMRSVVLTRGELPTPKPWDQILQDAKGVWNLTCNCPKEKSLEAQDSSRCDCPLDVLMSQGCQCGGS